MKKIVFYVNSGYARATREEEVEFEDDATGEEIEEAYRCWVSEYTGWYEKEE